MSEPTKHHGYLSKKHGYDDLKCLGALGVADRQRYSFASDEHVDAYDGSNN